MGPGDSLDSVSMGPAANLSVQNTSFQSKAEKSCILVPIKIKRPNYEYMMQDVQVKMLDNTDTRHQIEVSCKKGRRSL